MKLTYSHLITAALALAALVSHANAAVIASTDFDGRTATGAAASNLDWTVNGVNDPGDLTALNAVGDDLNLFNTTTLVQNIFAPALNTGNGNTFWTTNVSLTVASGAVVSLTDVTFGYWAVNGGQVQNVDRRSDFTIILFNPSNVNVGTVSINDVMNGTGVSNGSATPVELVFSSPIALTESGTYRLQIQGGDYAGTDETGNHTAIDNLSINGSVIPEPSALLLSLLGATALATRRKR